MAKYDYKPLGNYIDLVNIRNRDLSVTNLVGVSIEKKFIPSIANIIGTDLSPYKIIKNNQFAYGPVTSRNGDKITIALYKEKDDAILSQAYEVFKIKDENALLPDYLKLWVSRPEFDRYARFNSWGSARENFSFEDMKDIEIPIPDISIQKSIAEIYAVYTQRKEINEKLKAQIKDICPILIKGSLEEAV